MITINRSNVMNGPNSDYTKQRQCQYIHLSPRYGFAMKNKAVHVMLSFIDAILPYSINKSHCKLNNL